MANKRIFILFYSAVIFFSGILAWGIAKFGNQIFSEPGAVTSLPPPTAVPGPFETLLAGISQPLPILLIQVIVTILAAKAVGLLLRPFRQPNVVHQVIAGILLGPSLLGLVWPSAEAFIFPAASLKILQMFSQLGLILFMFVVGMELDPKFLKNRGSTAIVVSHVSIVFPFLLGMLLALWLYKDYAPSGVSFLSFALFMGIAMSITAFPVLARIIQEAGLTKTSLGALALTCAAIDDVTAWCLLAFVVAIVKSASIASAFVTVFASILFTIVMFSAVRPALRGLNKRLSPHGEMSRPFVSVSLLVLLLSALSAEVIGIHALFGAFVAGLTIPSEGDVRARLMEKVEDVSLVFLLPLFFAFTGLRTQISLMNDAHAWLICLTIIFIASVGKAGGTVFAARITRVPWKDALALGALMNTRGLMELVALNIGYDLGILTPAIFSMMVMMAIVTTFMTGPVVSLIRREDRLFSAASDKPFVPVEGI